MARKFKLAPPPIFTPRGWNGLVWDDVREQLYTTCVDCWTLLAMSDGPRCGNCVAPRRQAARLRRRGRKGQRMLEVRRQQPGVSPC